MIVVWMSNIKAKGVNGKPRLSLFWSMVAMLGNSVDVVASCARATSNTASHDNREKINSWVFFSFPWCLWGSAWRPFGPPELRYNVNNSLDKVLLVVVCTVDYGNIHNRSRFFAKIEFFSSSVSTCVWWKFVYSRLVSSLRMSSSILFFSVRYNPYWELELIVNAGFRDIRVPQKHKHKGEAVQRGILYGPGSVGSYHSLSVIQWLIVHSSVLSELK